MSTLPTPAPIEILAPEIDLNANHHQVGLRFNQEGLRYCLVRVGDFVVAGLASQDKPDTLWVCAAHDLADGIHANHLFVDLHAWPSPTKVEEPFIKVEFVTEPAPRQVTVTRNSRSGWGYGHSTNIKAVVTDGYDPGYYEPGVSHLNSRHGYSHSPLNANTLQQQYDNRIPFYYGDVRVTDNEGNSKVVTLRFPRPRTGTIDLTDRNLLRSNQLRVSLGSTDYIYTVDKFTDLVNLITGRYTITQGIDALWAWYFEAQHVATDYEKADNASMKSLWSRKAWLPMWERLRTEEPLLHRYLLYLHDSATIDKTTNNKLLAVFLKEVNGDYDKLRTALREALDKAHEATDVRDYHYNSNYTRSMVLGLPGAQEKIRQDKAKEMWQFRKDADGKAEGLGVDPERHPLLHKAILDGEIPFSIFHAPGNKQEIVNDEFDLWEACFEREGWKEPLVEIAQSAATRTTYDKPMSSYMAFLLYTLPEYLNRTAPRPDGSSWTCFPKFVASQWELEMDTDKQNEDGTIKKRSALTPTVDNEAGVVTVPYASMAIHGRMTTYCYSGNYYVAERGLNDPLGKGVFTKDFEPKLNGRDDYGLMFYTLIGTSRNEGYPSFLVIFERLEKRQKDTGLTTRVHFHRVRPNRSKGGIPTPTSRLIEECYRYMAGNIRAEEITAQQGDLIFIRADGPGNKVQEPAPVEAFESHAFVPLEGGTPVMVHRNAAKSVGNRLGYIHSDVPFTVQHPEHEDIERLDAGWWEVRRCKSWEANPVAVWSLTID